MNRKLATTLTIASTAAAAFAFPAHTCTAAACGDTARALSLFRCRACRVDSVAAPLPLTALNPRSTLRIRPAPNLWFV